MKMKGRTWARMAVALAAAITGVATSHAELIAYDDFEDAAPGSLDAQETGIGFAAGYVLAADAVAVVTNKTLSYANGDISINGGTNCVFIGYPDKVAFTRAIGTQNSDELYLSFLFNTPTADGNSNEDYLSFGFHTSAAETTGGVVHRRNAAVEDHSFGIRLNGANTLHDAGTEPDRTYFIVLRLRKLTPGAANAYTEFSLFVDPDSVYEPVPSLVVTNSRFTAATHISARIYGSEATDAYFLDNLCIGESYDAVVFPNGSPVVATPVFSPEGGAVIRGMEVSITSATPGASIHYTTDGSTPSPTHGTPYTAPVILADSMVLQAVAFKEGMYDSLVASAQFVTRLHWLGEGEDTNWLTPSNWYFRANPTGGDLVFGAEGRTSSTRVNGLVDADMTVSSLTYTNSNKFPAPVTSGWEWHVTEIPPGVTLTVDGSGAPESLLKVGGMSYNGEYNTYVKFLGGGALMLDNESYNATTENISNNHCGYPRLYLDELSSFHANVANFWAGRGKRTQAYVTLAAGTGGTNTIRAAHIGVGDSDDMNSANHGTSQLLLGTTNAFFANTLSVGAPRPGMVNVQSGTMSFQAGLASPLLVIRGRQGGDSRCDMEVGSHGTSATCVRTLTGTVNLTAGQVDARLGKLVVGRGTGVYWSGQYAVATGVMSMDSGIIDAEQLLLGATRTGSNSAARPTTGTLSVGGGRMIAGSAVLAHNQTGGGQTPVAVLNVSGGGTVEIDAPLVTGWIEGTALAATSRVDVAGGTLVVHDNMAPGNDSTNIVSEVLLSNGALCVTNTAGDAELRIENGTFMFSGGTATADRLVLTNKLCTTRVVLGGTENYGHAVVNAEVLLGGALEVSFAEGFVPEDGDVWKVVSGTGTRAGMFDPALATLPERLRVLYTNNGFDLVYPPLATLFMLR